MINKVLKMILVKNILKYRKYLKKNSNNKRIFKKYSLICDFNNFNGLGLKLLKSYFIKYNLSLNLYKNLFNKIYLSKKNSNLIYFQFNKFNSIFLFINLMQKLTTIPFFFFPLYIFNITKNILVPLNYLNLNKFNNLNKINLINFIIINTIKSLIISIVIKILKIINKKCQL